MMTRNFRWICAACLLLAFIFSTGLANKPSFRMRRLAADPLGGGDATLSPDGNRFVTTSRRTGNWEIWMYDIAGAAWTQLTNDPADDFEARWSPDGQRLVFCSTRTGQKDIWVLTLKTGALKQLTFSTDDDEYPAWSPDGKSVVYTGGPWGKRDYFIVSADGGSFRKVTRRSGFFGACAFEPRGTSLICHRYDYGSGDLIRLWLDDGDITPLTINNGWDYKPATSPNGRWVTFSRAEEGPSHIWVMPAEGGRPRQLTGANNDDRWPGWSGKGDAIFFHRLVEQGSALSLLDRQTGQVRQIVGADERPLQASFDPHAKRVVYCSENSGRKELKIIDLATNAIRTLPTGPGDACYPRWSPDGRLISFVAKRGPRWEIGVIEPTGKGLTMLTEKTPDLHGMDGPIDWSPDSSKLLFHADTRPFEASIYTIEVKTGVVTQLTDLGWFDESPSWAPDGKGVVFMSTRGGNWTWSFLHRSLADGATKTLAGPDWVEKNFPRMSTGGVLIYSLHEEDGEQYLAERSSDGATRTWKEAGPGARWPSFSIDDRWVLFTTVTRQVEYWLAENPFGAGSPMHTEKSKSAPEVKFKAPPPIALLPVLHEDDHSLQRKSPVDFQRR